MPNALPRSRKHLDQTSYLLKKGFGAVPLDRANQYSDDILSYLENFQGGLSFKRTDPSTIKEENLPIITEKGMLLGYGVAQEDFTWGIRQETGRGIPRGFKDEPNKICAWTNEWYGFTKEGMAWLDKKGFEWVKVNAEPGDLILWDSHTPHYNLSATGTTPRICAYTCYMPVSDASQEDLVRKKAASENIQSTTHWSYALHVGGIPVLRNGEPCPYNTGKPRGPVNLSKRGWQLARILYIKA
ncbi:hypothetical protein E8E11_006306 [Didymella keratinophila]|nr:hypothetical protein E8E11_006306 [Didymella keratinophila]